MFKKTALAAMLSIALLVSGCAVQQERGGKEEVVQQSYDDFIKNPPKFVAPQTKIKEVNDLFTAVVKMSELQYKSLLELDSVTRNNMAGYSVYVTTKRMEADAYKEWEEKNNPKPAKGEKAEEKSEENALNGFFGQIKANLERAQAGRERMAAERETFQASLKGKSATERNRMLVERQKLEEELKVAKNDLEVRIKRAQEAKLNAEVVRLNEDLDRIQTVEDWKKFKIERAERTKFVNSRLAPYMKKLTAQDKKSFGEYVKARDRITQQVKARQDELGNIVDAIIDISRGNKLHGLNKWEKIDLGLDVTIVLGTYAWASRASSWFDVFDAQLQNAQTDQGR